MTAFPVRPAVAGDIPGIARVHVSAWRDTYAHLIPAENLARLDAHRIESRWAEGFDDRTDDLFVALDEGEVVGWISVVDADGPDAARSKELAAMNVLTAWHGSGAGQALLDAALGDAAAFLWVAADNPRAHAFYRRNRFGLDSATRAFPMLGVAIPTERMVR